MIRFLFSAILLSLFFLLLPKTMLFGQVVNSLPEEISIEEIQKHRSTLIEAGYLNEPSEAFTSFSTSSEPILNYASYTGTNIRLQTASTRDVDFRPNGGQFYAVGRNSLNIAEYNVSNSWNIGSASHRRELDISPEMGSASQPNAVPHGVFLKRDDGIKMYIINRTEIWEYTLSTPWNINSATQTGYKDLSEHVLRGHGVFFRPNGRVMYVDDRFVGAVFQYNLSTAWDINTATLDFALNISAQQQEVRGNEFSPDGDRMFLLDTVRRELLEYSLSTPYDLRSASLIGTFSVSSQSSDPRGFTLKSDMKGFYVTDATSNRMYQYQITFPPDPQLSTITSSQSKVQANNQNNTRITVVAKDRDGVLLQGVRADLRVGNSTVQTATTNSSGEALFDVISSNIEQIEFRARVAGVQIQGSVVIDFIGIDANRSSLTSNTSRVLSDGSAYAEITVTARDEDNQPFSNLSMELIPNGGSSSIQAVQSTTNSQGVARFRVSNQTSEQVTYRARGLGTTITDRVTITFIGVDADLSSMSISENRVQANGQNQGEITIIVRDQENELLSGLNIDLLPDRGSSSIETIQSTSDSQGRAVFRVSNQTPEQVTYRARGMGVTLTDRVTVDFLGVDADLSSITVSNDHIQANGTDQAEITVSVRDVDDRPFTNLTMELIPDRGSSVIENVQSTTNNDGVATFRVSSQLPEQITYSARGLGVTISETVVVNFIPVAPVALSATNVETRSFSANWELVQGADSYRLDVAIDSTFSDYLSGFENRNAGLVTTYPIDNALPGRTYYYRVRAAIGDLIGANSETIRLTTFPDTPVASSASNRNALNFTANWQPAEGAESYRLDVAKNSDFSEMVPGFDNVDTGNQTSKTIDGLEPGTDYFYRVRSVAGPRTSPGSNNIATSTLAISAENSSIEKEQLRILANGNQTNEITILVKSDEGIALNGLTITLIPDGGQSVINAIQSQTDENGIAIFSLSSTQAETVTYQAEAHQTLLGSFTVEFLPDSGELALGNNYPNPFQVSTTLPVTVPRVMNIEITIYDQLGRPVQTVVNSRYEPGYFEIPFRAHGLASGIYFYRLVTGDEIITKRMVLVR